MKLHELKPTKSSCQVCNRIGRGTSSGSGKTAGRGREEQRARSGGGVCLGFGGGQTSLFHCLPKRGFANMNYKDHVVVDLDVLNHFKDGAEITPVALVEAGVVKNEKAGIKVLANRELNKRLTMKATKFSRAAQEAIEVAGGSIEVI